jgi:transcriptional regulator with XRE-family HTH domain
MTSGVTLREERLASQVQQQDLAAELGVGHSALAQLEQRLRVRPETAARYRAALISCTKRETVKHISTAIEVLDAARRSLAGVGDG